MSFFDNAFFDGAFFDVGAASGGVATTYSGLAGDRIYGGRSVPVRNPSLISFSWPPGPNVTTPNAEGVNAPIHPSVVDFGSSPWNGYRYWMAFTPYPIGDDVTKENPCVVASHDGDTWVALRSNPIVPAPANAGAYTQYLSDTHLAYHAGTLYLIYREVDRRTAGLIIERLWVCSTTDGITYTSPQMFLETSPTSEMSMALSPSVEWWNGQWWCWTVSSTQAPYVCHVRTAQSITGPWSAPTLCVAALPNGARHIWHLDVKRIPNGWAMLITDRPVTGTSRRNAWFAYSADGITWGVSASPLSLEAPDTYRSAFLRAGAGFDCWIGDHDARKIRRLRINDEQV